MRPCSSVDRDKIALHQCAEHVLEKSLFPTNNLYPMQISCNAPWEIAAFAHNVSRTLLWMRQLKSCVAPACAFFEMGALQVQGVASAITAFNI